MAAWRYTVSVNCSEKDGECPCHMPKSWVGKNTTNHFGRRKNLEGRRLLSMESKGRCGKSLLLETPDTVGIFLHWNVRRKSFIIRDPQRSMEFKPAIHIQPERRRTALSDHYEKISHPTVKKSMCYCAKYHTWDEEANIFLKKNLPLEPWRYESKKRRSRTI